jgi:alpha-L-rhamnosidase
VADGGSDECEYESHQSLKPVSVKSVSETDTYIVDLGQNIAGWIRMKVKGNRGDR